MPKTKPIKIKEIHNTYTTECHKETETRIRELLAEAFLEFYNSNKSNPLN